MFSLRSRGCDEGDAYPDGIEQVHLREPFGLNDTKWFKRGSEMPDMTTEPMDELATAFSAMEANERREGNEEAAQLVDLMSSDWLWYGKTVGKQHQPIAVCFGSSSTTSVGNPFTQ